MTAGSTAGRVAVACMLVQRGLSAQRWVAVHVAFDSNRPCRSSRGYHCFQLGELWNPPHSASDKQSSLRTAAPIASYRLRMQSSGDTDARAIPAVEVSAELAVWEAVPAESLAFCAARTADVGVRVCYGRAVKSRRAEEAGLNCTTGEYSDEAIASCAAAEGVGRPMLACLQTGSQASRKFCVLHWTGSAGVRSTLESLPWHLPEEVPYHRL